MTQEPLDVFICAEASRQEKFLVFSWRSLTGSWDQIATYDDLASAQRHAEAINDRGCTARVAQQTVDYGPVTLIPEPDDPSQLSQSQSGGAGAYRVALRESSANELDDVVVRDVSMFRAERLNDKALWLACYLPGKTGGDDGDDGNRITFIVTATRSRLEFQVHETPEPPVTFEPQPASGAETEKRS